MNAREAIPALTLPAGTPLADAARLLRARGAHEALVTEDERLVLRTLVLDEPEAVA